MRSMCSSASFKERAEAVELGDDDPVAQATLDAFDRGEEERSVGSAAGLVEFLEDLLEAGVVQRAPGADGFTLDAGGDERRAATPTDVRHADIADEAQRVVSDAHVPIVPRRPPLRLLTLPFASAARHPLLALRVAHQLPERAHLLLGVG